MLFHLLLPGAVWLYRWRTAGVRFPNTGHAEKSSKRAAVMQIILALAAAIGGISAWFLGGSRLWFVGAVLIVAVIPFECLPELVDFDGERGDGFFEHTGSVTASLPTKRARGVHLGWKEVPV